MVVLLLSDSSDLELDDAPDQLLSQLPNSDDFGAALGQRGTVLRAHPLHEKLSFPANRDTNPMHISNLSVWILHWILLVRFGFAKQIRLDNIDIGWCPVE